MIRGFQGKTALITGAGSGIGRAIAKRLAGEGLVCILAGRREEKLRETAALIRGGGGRSYVVPCDITDMKQQRELISKTMELCGGFDLLINNAGTALGSAFESVTEEQFDRIMNVNVRAPFMLCQKALPILRESECATIINIASVVAHKGYPGQSAYAASKHALFGFTKALAGEVYDQNIRVHVISPGSVYTDLIAGVRPDLTPDGMILAEDVADAVIYFLQHRFTNAVVDEIEIHRAGKQPFL